jgi:hypothetical protein
LASQEQGQIGLSYAHDFGGSGLGPPFAIDDVYELADKLGLGQMIFGIWKANVIKDISAATSDPATDTS